MREQKGLGNKNEVRQKRISKKRKKEKEKKEKSSRSKRTKNLYLFCPHPWSSLLVKSVSVALAPAAVL